MKQNSSILFHFMAQLLTNRYRVGISAAVTALFCLFASANGAERPEYLASFDPAKGFRPAQRDLAEIFLQIAGSLEYYGSPVPYIRHMQQEHARIEALYRQKYASAPKSFRPAYMTDDYLNRFAANWDILSPNLGLESFAKEVGNTMRDAILGTRGTGTIIVEILNQHQARVFDAMAGKGSKGADFEALKSQLITRLELDKTRIDDINYSIPRRDAVRSAIIIHGKTIKLFNRIDEGLKPADAERVETVVTSMIMDVGEMAQSELQAGIVEWIADKSSTAAK
jgi:hypothetical protein